VTDDPDILALYSAIGRMVLGFADMERSIHRTVLHYTKMDDDTGRSVLSGLSFTPAIEALRSLISNNVIKGNRATELLAVAEHAAVLLGARDFVVHYGSSLSMVIEADERTSERRNCSGTSVQRSWRLLRSTRSGSLLFFNGIELAGL
jgi:hypothetical protein